MRAVKSSIKNGYTLFIGGDVSESGYDSHAEVAVVPSYDIPSEYIDENARQFRFSNKTTTTPSNVNNTVVTILVKKSEKPNKKKEIVTLESITSHAKRIPIITGNIVPSKISIT